MKYRYVLHLGWISKTLYQMKRSQAREVTYCVIPLIWNTQNRQIHGDGGLISAPPPAPSGERAEESACFLGLGALLGWWRSSGTKDRRLYNLGNVLNAAELFTLKWLIICYVNSTSVLKRGREASGCRCISWFGWWVRGTCLHKVLQRALLGYVTRNGIFSILRKEKVPQQIANPSLKMKNKGGELAQPDI